MVTSVVKITLISELNKTLFICNSSNWKCNYEFQ